MYVPPINLIFICLFIDYSRWHPPWEVNTVCDEACLALVVLRAALLFLAFVIVCLTKNYFTNTSMST